MPAEEKEESQEKSGGGGGKTALLVVVVSLVALGAGAGGAWFFLKPGAEASAAPARDAAAAGAAEAQQGAPPGADFRERLYSLEPFVVNVTGDGYSRYLKVKLDLEAESSAVRDELDARLPQVRDAVIVLLSSKRLSDITDFEGKAMLKQDIQLRINDVLEGGDVQSVLFTEFVVQ